MDSDYLCLVWTQITKSPNISKIEEKIKKLAAKRKKICNCSLVESRSIPLIISVYPTYYGIKITREKPPCSIVKHGLHLGLDFC